MYARMKNDATMTAMVALRTVAVETTGDTVENSGTSKVPKRASRAFSMVPRSPGTSGRGVAVGVALLAPAPGATVALAAAVALAVAVAITVGVALGTGVGVFVRSCVSEAFT